MEKLWIQVLACLVEFSLVFSISGFWCRTFWYPEFFSKIGV